MLRAVAPTGNATRLFAAALLWATGIGLARPAAAALDCASASELQCGDSIAGDLATGSSGQATYGCSSADYSGRELVYLLTVNGPAPVVLRLEATSGNPDLIVLTACDPAGCAGPPADTFLLAGTPATYTLVVDSRAGEEGGFTLRADCLVEDFGFCTDAPDGGGFLQHDPWGFGNGTWLVYGWLYHTQHTHDYALRVDGRTKYSTLGGDCTRLPPATFGAVAPGGPGIVRWSVREATVVETLTETRDRGCCGIGVEVVVTNADTVPHAYEWRIYHDTAFGDGAPGGACALGDEVDGGPIEVDGVRYDQEVELLPLGGDTCPGQVEFFSADDGFLKASFEMLSPNAPQDMEFIRWNDGAEPCTTWSGLVDNTMGTGCNDNSLLLIWRFPALTGTLAPGETATARYRIGWRCRWPCGACASPVMGAVAAADAGPCNDGIVLDWGAATFPGAGRGVYHVYRSLVSTADALSLPPITPPGGITALTFADPGTAANAQHWYVVQAESLDFPGCGSGPAVDGSTAEASVGPIVDASDLSGPPGVVGNALRATGHGTDTVDFAWPLAPPPGSSERYVVLRSDDRPQGPFAVRASALVPAWTDPDAPPRYEPAHVWFYDVRLADACGNVSAD